MQKHGLSSGVDVVDVQFVLAAFEEMNKCKLELSMWLEGTAARPVVWLEMRAWEPGADKLAVQPLACQKSPVGSSGPRSMEAAILQGMYALDAQMAEAEFARVDKK